MTALVDRLEQLASLATPGPWTHDRMDADEFYDEYVRVKSPADSAEWDSALNIFGGDEDAALIVELRNALPDLVEAVRAAREYQNEMEKVAHEWRMDWSDFDGRILRDQEADAARRLCIALSALFGEEAA